MVSPGTLFSFLCGECMSMSIVEENCTETYACMCFARALYPVVVKVSVHSKVVTFKWRAVIAMAREVASTILEASTIKH